MTEEEKKEYEEFLQWKAEKAKKEAEQTKQDNEESAKKDSQGNGIIFIIVGILFVLIILIIAAKGCNNKKEDMLAEVAIEEDSLATESIGEPASGVPIAANNGKEWTFTTEIDEMTDTKNIWASIVSDNSVNLSSPYGLSNCRVTVRYMKKWGGFDVLVQLTSGQIHGSEYHNENYVMVRFDDEKPIKYWYNEAADASSDCVFIRNKSDFIARCKKAKSIKVEVPIFQGGRPVFTFEVTSPLEWKE